MTTGYKGDKFPLGAKKSQYDIGHYRSFLTKYVVMESIQGHTSRIALVAVELASSNDPLFLQPFLQWDKSPATTPEWWAAFNAVKHSDMDEFREGSLLNCLNALAALATLKRLLDNYESHRVRGRLRRRTLDCSDKSGMHGRKILN
jgi:hypothetical protein